MENKKTEKNAPKKSQKKNRKRIESLSIRAGGLRTIGTRDPTPPRRFRSLRGFLRFCCSPLRSAEACERRERERERLALGGSQEAVCCGVVWRVLVSERNSHYSHDRWATVCGKYASGSRREKLKPAFEPTRLVLNGPERIRFRDRKAEWLGLRVCVLV